MVDETVYSILVKEGRVEITFLFHSNCIILQCCFYKEVMNPYTLKYMIFYLYFAFFHVKIRLRIPRAVEFHSKKEQMSGYYILWL